MGAAGGLISGALANQKEGGTSANNVLGQNVSGWQAAQNNAYNQLQGVNSNDSANQVMGNPLYSGLFGQGGALQNAQSQLQKEQDQGYNLTSGDQTAYGQASGNIARQFGQNTNSLSQALSNRGLSNSGAAGAAFSGALGNQNEQLAGLQTQIAQNRMNLNQQAMANTQNFISQLGGQAQNAVNSQNQLGMNKALGGFNMGLQSLQANQNQQNEQLQQQQQTQHASTLANTVNGGIAGDASDKQLGASVIGSVGKMAAM